MADLQRWVDLSGAEQTLTRALEHLWRTGPVWPTSEAALDTLTASRILRSARLRVAMERADEEVR